LLNVTVQSLIEDYAFNSMLIYRYADDLSNEESLIQPEFDHNCFNWVLGHIVQGRNDALHSLDCDPVWGEVYKAKYERGSARLRTTADAVPITDLLEYLKLTEEKMKEKLLTSSDEFLDQVVSTSRGDKSRIADVASLHWHESYHLGQLDILRMLSISKRPHGSG